ncbi:MAG: hypothetical protein C0631_00830 [Sedimenticola sp.]|nr:MAG: hypothetical protein C0631_00830 [Sedimenticola sp.]
MNSGSEITIPGYRIERTLGKGGMATVYLATQMSLGRAVALKILNDPDTPQFFERFFNEGRFVSRLNRSNLVTIYDIGQGDGFYYIAMEYLPGGDLKARIMQGIKPSHALKIVSKLTSCLSYVHSQGLIHRDIKPSNVMFRSDDTPVLTDFGIAKLIQTDNDLTITGTILGSPHYLSPEQAESSVSVDGRSDLYSIGIILFEMLTGRKPYNASSFAATLMAHIKDPIPQLPEQFELYQPIIEKLLAKSPDERFQNGTELIIAIQQLRSRSRSQHRKTATGDQAPDERHPPAAKPSETDHEKPGRSKYTSLFWGGAIGLVALTALAFIGKDKPLPPQVGEPETAAEQITQQPPVENEQPVPLEESDPIEADEESSGDEQVTAEAEPLASDPLTRTEQLLARAEQSLRKNRLTRPAGDNAYLYFSQVLADDPKNAQAREGIQRTADRYLLLAQKRVDQEKLSAAEKLIASGLKVVPEHAQLLALQSQVELALRPVEPEPIVVPPPKPPPPPPKKEKPWEFHLMPKGRGG